MKQKYKRFTNEYCRQLSFLHWNCADLKEHINIIYEYHLYRKKFDFSKRNYHYKFNPYLHDTLDVRRGRRILNNPKLFEEHFNFECETLCKRLKYEAEKAERKRITKEEQEKQFNNYRAKILHDLYAKNVIGDIKCLPV